jgi:hypothetical protein
MQDETENYRRARQAQLNYEASLRAPLEAQYGKVWDNIQLRRDFDVIGFMAPLVAVRERATGKKGSLEFQHSPRFYFNWQQD